MRQRRYEFSKKVRMSAWIRCQGNCECGCGMRIEVGNGPAYHHAWLPATEPGSDTLENCLVLRERPCHQAITAEETIPMHAKQKRVLEKRIGARDKRRPFQSPPPGYNPWTRRIDN